MRDLSARLPILHKLAAIGLLTALLLAGTAEAGSFSVIGQSRWVEVRYVVDGDTFTTKRGEKVRLLGINTPEVAHNREPGQPYGQEAKHQLQALIGGRAVQLFTDKDSHDMYGRLLAEVYLRDGTWVNAALVRKGYAHVYTFAPNFRWTADLLKEESVAMRQRRGIWSLPRFRVLQANEMDRRLTGQFRVVEGVVSDAGRWHFRLARLNVTVPRKYRQWFSKALPENGQKVRIRATLRISSHGKMFAAIHSPYDLEVIR